jgi:hypothetical protein
MGSEPRSRRVPRLQEGYHFIGMPELALSIERDPEFHELAMSWP